KVIPRKDLPNIYTTFVPVDGGGKGPARPDFEKGTEELIDEVLRAPARLGATLAVVTLIGIAACAAALWLEASWKVYALLGVATVLSVIVGLPIAKAALRREEGRILRGLDTIFARIHA